jgi:NAD(P)-dependent dehydrogenase (short-subunit alcohol dehydrogenase family)
MTRVRALEQLKPGSAIVNTGSETGLFRARRRLLDYAATKGGIHAFSKSLAAASSRGESASMSVAPGPVWTPLNPADRSGDKVANFGAKTQMKRPRNRRKSRPAFVFLAAPVCSSYITGIELPIIGRTPRRWRISKASGADDSSSPDDRRFTCSLPCVASRRLRGAAYLRAIEASLPFSPASNTEGQM